jgi:aryl-alcohol dehydrogenase-like predicted oxidoreductase
MSRQQFTPEFKDEAVRQGKVRYVGSSNLPGWQIAVAEHTARSRGTQRFVAAQMEWSLLQRAVEAEQVASNAAALGDWLGPEDLEDLDRALAGVESER